MGNGYLSSPRGYSSGSNRLGRSTGIAFIVSICIMIAVVLPAEYGIDPTGVGKILGLKTMGEIKQSLAKEAAQEKSGTVKPVPQDGTAASQIPPEQSIAVSANPLNTQSLQRQEHQMTITLDPDQGAEVKLDMKKGMEATYSWVVNGGLINFDAHGNPYESSKSFNHSYGSGRQVEGDKGVLVASFDGLHGWFWRNRSGKKVTVTLTTSGTYLSIKRTA